jgi:hypothetical protein
LPEMGQNLVWKHMDLDPSLYLNDFNKAKGVFKSLHVLTR